MWCCALLCCSDIIGSADLVLVAQVTRLAAVSNSGSDSFCLSNCVERGVGYFLHLWFLVPNHRHLLEIRSVHYVYVFFFFPCIRFPTRNAHSTNEKKTYVRSSSKNPLFFVPRACNSQDGKKRRQKRAQIHWGMDFQTDFISCVWVKGNFPVGFVRFLN